MSETNEIATTQQNLPVAAMPQPPARPGMIENTTGEDLELPVLHLFQDIGKESDQYGEHDKGDWIDSLTLEAIKDPIIIPVSGKKEFVVWYDRDSTLGKGLVNKYDTRAEVPSEYQEDQANYIISETVTFYVLVSGEQLPAVIRFKSTALKVARQLNTLERIRAAKQKCLGQYKLGVTLRSNDKGKWYVPMITPNGDASQADQEAAIAAYNMITGGNVTVHDVEEMADDDIPI